MASLDDIQKRADALTEPKTTALKSGVNNQKHTIEAMIQSVEQAFQKIKDDIDQLTNAANIDAAAQEIADSMTLNNTTEIENRQIVNETAVNNLKARISTFVTEAEGIINNVKGTEPDLVTKVDGLKKSLEKAEELYADLDIVMDVNKPIVDECISQILELCSLYGIDPNTVLQAGAHAR